MNMKQRIINICTMALLAVLGVTVLAACGGSDSNDDGGNSGVPEGMYRFTTVLNSKGADNSVMKLQPSKDGKEITATWAVGEEVAVVNQSFTKKLGTLIVTSVNGNGSAVVTGNVKEIVSGTSVSFVYPASAVDDDGSVKDLITSQDGMLETISKSRDLAIGTGSVVISGFNATVQNNPVMVNQNAICKFRFKDTSTGNILSDIKKIEIRDAGKDALVTIVEPAASGLNAVYVVMQPTPQKEFKFIVYTRRDIIYIGTQAGVLEQGKYYDDSNPIPVKP